MNTWIQRSDFSSKDIDSLDSFEKFQSFIDTLATEELDAEMLTMQQRKQDHCPWGIGINMDTSSGLHVCREDPTADTYTVFTTKVVKKKLFGFIPTAKNLDAMHEGLSKDAMLQVAEEYYQSLVS